jgi:hypothetical protein
MRYIKIYENFGDDNVNYNYYFTIYVGKEGFKEILSKVIMIKWLIDNNKTFKGVKYKICYLDPKDWVGTRYVVSESFLFLLDKKVDDIKTLWKPFIIHIHNITNFYGGGFDMTKCIIPNNDLDMFFDAKKYNL